MSSSTFSNYDIRYSFAPAIEYNVFPYSESSRRSLTFEYRAGAEYVEYDETTVFGQDEEWLYRNALEISLSARQPWGSASLSLSGEAFMDDWEKNSLSAFGNLQFRIVRGLNLNLFGSISRIRNRVNEPGSDATEEDILLRQRILATSISYNFSVGLSYRFGSIFNNVVNPRFGGGGSSSSRERSVGWDREAPGSIHDPGASIIRGPHSAPRNDQRTGRRDATSSGAHGVHRAPPA